jgi:2-methylcitrate dehydratase PrpD
MNAAADAVANADADALLHRLAVWVSAFRLDNPDLDPDVRSRLRGAAIRSIIDTIGVAVDGTQRPAAQAARRLARMQYAPGAGALFGATPADRAEAGLVSAGAAFANTVAAHADDLDDTCYVGIAHGSAVVLPAALAAGQAVGANGRDLLDAFIAGSEATYAVGRMMGDHLYFKGFWNTGVLGAIGAAAAASRISRLTPDETAHAMAIAATQVMGLRACLGRLVKPVMAGRASEAGVTAALLASMGIDGPLTILEGDNGWAKVLNDGQIDPAALDQLGAPPVLIEPGVAFKMYPVCSAAQAAVETVCELLRENSLSGDEVAHVRCDVTPLVHISLRYPQPQTPAESQFSMPFAVGCALAFGALTPSHLNPTVLADPALLTAMARVEMRLDPEMAADPKAMELYPEGSRVTMTLRDGRTLSRFRGVCTGMPTQPMPDAMLHAKFHACADPVIGATAADSLLSRLLTLEQLDDLAALFTGQS